MTTLSMYQASVPGFVRALNNLRHVLQQGAAHAQSKGVADATMLQTRLTPDMLPLVKQVQIAADMACRGAARLAGQEARVFEDNETTFAQLDARLAAAIDYLQQFGAAQIDGSEGRTIQFQTRAGELNMDGVSYLLYFVLPNLFFHCTTAYDILRVAGAPLGKADFLGKI